MRVASLYQKALDLQSAIPYRFGDGWAFPPMQVIVYLTYNCNLACEMCNFTEMIQEVRDNVNAELSAEEIMGVLDQLPFYSLVTFTGGEPTMKRGFEEILTHAARQRKCHMITNGTRLTPDRSKFLVGLGPKSLLGNGLVSLGVSIESRDAGAHDEVVGLKGAHEKATAGILHIQEEKRRAGKKYPLLHLSAVISASTAPHLADVYRLSTELGVEMCNFIMNNTSVHLYRYDENKPEFLNEKTPAQEPIDPALLDDQFKQIEGLSQKSPVEVRFSLHGITLEEIKDYYQNRPTMRRYFCKAPWNTMLLSPKGQVMPCYYAPLGNVREKTVGELWNGWAAREFRRMIHDQKFLPGCVGCCNGQFGTGEAVPIFS